MNTEHIYLGDQSNCSFKDNAEWFKFYGEYKDLLMPLSFMVRI